MKMDPTAVQVGTNFLTMQYGSMDEALRRSDDYEILFPYLVAKMQKHRAANNIERLVTYYMYMIRLPFEKATEEAISEVKTTKAYLRKCLLL